MFTTHLGAILFLIAIIVNVIVIVFFITVVISFIGLFLYSKYTSALTFENFRLGAGTQ